MAYEVERQITHLERGANFWRAVAPPQQGLDAGEQLGHGKRLSGISDSVRLSDQ
jgi:hypothetical protein